MSTAGRIWTFNTGTVPLSEDKKPTNAHKTPWLDGPQPSSLKQNCLSSVILDGKSNIELGFRDPSKRERL